MLRSSVGPGARELGIELTRVGLRCDIEQADVLVFRRRTGFPRARRSGRRRVLVVG